MLEGEPKEDREEGENEDRLQAVDDDVRGRVILGPSLGQFGGFVGVHLVADSAEQRARPPELQRAKNHEGAGQAEAEVPRHLLADVTAQRNTEKGAGIHAHVEQRVAAIALAFVVLRVELTHDGRNVRLEEAGAERDQPEACIKHRHGFCEQCNVPGRNDEAAKQHRTARAQEAVSDVAAQDGRHVHGKGVPAVQTGRVSARPAPAALADLADQEEHQQRAHAVVREAFPHFCEEQDEQRIGLPQDAGLWIRVSEGLQKVPTESFGDEREGYGSQIDRTWRRVILPAT